MFDFIDQSIATMMMAMRQPVESFIQLETADDETTLAASDGSMVSTVKLFGSRQIIGDVEYQWIIDQATLKLGSRFDRPGYAMQVYFMRDPSTVGQDIEHAMKPNRSAIRAMELDLNDLLNERSRHLARYMAHEEIYLVLWTRPSILTKTEANQSIKERGKKKWVRAPNAQYPMQALSALRTRHKSFVSSIVSALEEIGMKAEVMTSHEALAATRSSIYPGLGREEWRANLPGDPLVPRAPQHGKDDASDILWPPLRQQLCVGDAAQVTPNIVRIGSMLWAGVDMTLAPTEPSPFPQILNRLIDNDVPFRISFLIESAGVHGSAFRAFAAGVLGFTNQVNKQIRESLMALQEISHSEPVVKLRISLATYAHQNDRKLMETRISALTQAVEAWGYCQASSAGGDPLDMVMSSALGIACASTAPPVCAPFRETVKLHHGSVLHHLSAKVRSFCVQPTDVCGPIKRVPH